MIIEQTKPQFLTEALIEVCNNQWKVDALESGHSVYTQTRKVGDSNTANRGELSKSFWDAQS